MFTLQQPEAVISETLAELSAFTPMEQAFRSYYRLMHGLESPEEETRGRIVADYTHYARMLTPFLPDGMDPIFLGSSIRILKHARYIPGRLHTHSFIEMFYVLQGNCTHVCGNQRYALQPGDFCLWQFNIPHYIQSDSDGLLALNILVQKPAFKAAFFEVLSEDNLLSAYFNKIFYGNGDSPMLLFRTKDDRRLLGLICSMYLEQQKKEVFYQSMMFGELHLLFAHLLRSHSEHLITSARRDAPDFSVKILQYIQIHYATVTLEDLCREFHYSASYLSRLIKQKTGNTFREIIAKEKMRSGAYLLTHTSRTVAQIAEEVNCCDASHFGRLFQRIYQMSPTEYRNKENCPDSP